MESCVTTGTGVALGVDRWLEMPSLATPFAVRGGYGKQGGSGRRAIVVTSIKILMER